MKCKSILAVLAAATLLGTSCSKESDTGKNGSYEQAVLSVNLANTPTRATGTPGATDDVITDVNIFITDNTNDIAWSQYFTASQLNGVGSNEAEMTVSTAAANVYIIANAGADLTSTITSMAQLNGTYTIDLLGAGQNQSNARWATGSAAIPAFAQDASGDWKSSVSVTANFLASRITVSIIDNMSPAYDGTASNGDLVIKDVAVMNAVKTSKLFGASLVPATKNYYTGIDGNAQTPVWSPFPAAANVTLDVANMVDNIPTDDFTTKYYYYVFENDAITATAFPTIVTIRGELDGDDIYYPIHLAPYEQFLAGTMTNGLERGKSYDLTFKLSVDPTDHSGGGGINPPVSPLVSADVTVTIDINDWVPVTLSKEFS